MCVYFSLCSPGISSTTSSVVLEAAVSFSLCLFWLRRDIEARRPNILPMISTTPTIKSNNRNFAGVSYTVKPVLSDHSKIDKTKKLMINGSLNEGRNYCRMFPLEHSAIL